MARQVITKVVSDITGEEIANEAADALIIRIQQGKQVTVIDAKPTDRLPDTVADLLALRGARKQKAAGRTAKK